MLLIQLAIEHSITCTVPQNKQKLTIFTAMCNNMDKFHKHNGECKGPDAE